MTAAPIQWDELCNVVLNYPVWPGDTISHSTMNRLGELGLALRQANGFWIPTAKGLERYAAGPQVGDRGTQRFGQYQ